MDELLSYRYATKEYVQARIAEAMHAAGAGTITPADEGKVVSGGVLVSQTAHAQITVNGTYDTTLNNSVSVNVPGTPKVIEFTPVSTTDTVELPAGDFTLPTNYFWILSSDVTAGDNANRISISGWKIKTTNTVVGGNNGYESGYNHSFLPNGSPDYWAYAIPLTQSGTNLSFTANQYWLSGANYKLTIFPFADDM